MTSSLNNNYGGRRILPYVFTEEEGKYMLISVLKGAKSANLHKTLLKNLHNLNYNAIIASKFM